MSKLESPRVPNPQAHHIFEFSKLIYSQNRKINFRFLVRHDPQQSIWLRFVKLTYSPFKHTNIIFAKQIGGEREGGGAFKKFFSRFLVVILG